MDAEDVIGKRVRLRVIDMGSGCSKKELEDSEKYYEEEEKDGGECIGDIAIDPAIMLRLFPTRRLSPCETREKCIDILHETRNGKGMLQLWGLGSGRKREDRKRGIAGMRDQLGRGDGSGNTRRTADMGASDDVGEQCGGRGGSKGASLGGGRRLHGVGRVEGAACSRLRGGGGRKQEAKAKQRTVNLYLRAQIEANARATQAPRSECSHEHTYES